jgi:uncharacterized protein YgiM (DUF1202 family)
MSRYKALAVLAICVGCVGLACVMSAGAVPSVGEPTPKVLETSIPSPTLSPTLYPTHRVTAARSLNVRQTPGTQARVIGALYTDDPVQMTGKCKTGWAEIVWKTGRAWVNAGYLSDNLCKVKK